MKITPFWILLGIAVGVPVLTIWFLLYQLDSLIGLLLLIIFVPLMVCFFVGFVILALVVAQPESTIVRALRVVGLTLFGLAAFAAGVVFAYVAFYESSLFLFFMPVAAFTLWVAAAATARVVQDIQHIWQHLPREEA